MISTNARGPVPMAMARNNAADVLRAGRGVERKRTRLNTPHHRDASARVAFTSVITICTDERQAAPQRHPRSSSSRCGGTCRGAPPPRPTTTDARQQQQEKSTVDTPATSDSVDSRISRSMQYRVTVGSFRVESGGIFERSGTSAARVGVCDARTEATRGGGRATPTPRENRLGLLLGLRALGRAAACRKRRRARDKAAMQARYASPSLFEKRRRVSPRTHRGARTSHRE